MDSGFTDALNFELTYGVLWAKSSKYMYSHFKKENILGSITP